MQTTTEPAALRARQQPPIATSTSPGLEVVVPVYNEERILRQSMLRLHRRLLIACDVPFRLTIADNASSDRTPEIARALARELPGVRHLRLEQKGRGRALRAAWGASDADVVAYMDVDLSTDLAHIPELIGPLLAGQADIVIGSRLARGARVTRGFTREVISRGYNALLGLVLGAGFSDAQCGFKAGRGDVIRTLLPLIEDEGWFFDTELLYLAQRNGFSIREVPVHWVDDIDSRVHLRSTIADDLKGIARLRRRTRAGEDRAAPAIGRAWPAAPAAQRRRSVREAQRPPRLRGMHLPPHRSGS